MSHTSFYFRFCLPPARAILNRVCVHCQSDKFDFCQLSCGQDLRCNCKTYRARNCFYFTLLLGLNTSRTVCVRATLFDNSRTKVVEFCLIFSLPLSHLACEFHTNKKGSLFECQPKVCNANVRAGTHTHTHARNSSKVTQIAVKLLESEISSKCQKVSNLNLSEI